MFYYSVHFVILQCTLHGITVYFSWYYSVLQIKFQVFSSMSETLQIEEDTPTRLLHNIKDLAHMLYTNVSRSINHSNAYKMCPLTY